MKDCVFCRIVEGAIPSTKVYEDEHLLGFRDLEPHAPLHALIVPKRHIATVNDLVPTDDALIGSMLRAAATMFNCNGEAGQTVFHIHLHLLAGRSLGWPPG
jgi:histidine triad (HIT) family protein